jgi:hypothetical protein
VRSPRGFAELGIAQIERLADVIEQGEARRGLELGEQWMMASNCADNPASPP